MTSPDGRTWTTRTASEANNWRDVCWATGLGLFVAVSDSGTHQVMTSPDGINWTNRTHADTGCLTVAWDPVNARLVAMGSDWPNYQWSDNATSWTSVNGGWTGNAGCVTAIDTAGGFFMVGHNDINRYDADGKGTWTAGAGVGQGGFTDFGPRACCWSYATSLYILAVKTGTTGISTSPDGHTWTNRTLSSANPWVSVADSSHAPPPRPHFQARMIG
jgi:hypothetical protein